MPIDVVILLKNSSTTIKQWRTERNAQGDVIAVVDNRQVPHEEIWSDLLESLQARSRQNKSDAVEVFLCLSDDLLDSQFDYDLMEQLLYKARQCKCENCLYLVKDQTVRFDSSRQNHLPSLDKWFESALKNWGTDIIEADLKSLPLVSQLRLGADASERRMKIVQGLPPAGRWMISLPPINKSLKSFLKSFGFSPGIINHCLIVVDDTIETHSIGEENPLIKWIENKRREYSECSFIIAVLGMLSYNKNLEGLEDYCRQNKIEIVQYESMFQLRYFLMQYARPKAFVVMPFREKMDEIYEIIKNTCYEQGIRVNRADEISGAGYVMQDVVNLIQASDIIICDLTFERPNVYYELGYTHGKMIHSSDNILLVAKEGTEVHFNVASLRIQFYRKTTLRDILNRNLKRMIL